MYDLDKQQLVDFRLHPWADHYLTLRADLYGGDDDNKSGDMGNKNASSVSSDEAIDDPNGTRHVFCTVRSCSSITATIAAVVSAIWVECAA